MPTPRSSTSFRKEFRGSLVRVGVAAHLPAHVQRVDDLPENDERRGLVRQSVLHLLGDLVESSQIEVDRELRVLLLGDQERGARARSISASELESSSARRCRGDRWRGLKGSASVTGYLPSTGSTRVPSNGFRPL